MVGFYVGRLRRLLGKDKPTFPRIAKEKSWMAPQSRHHLHWKWPVRRQFDFKWPVRQSRLVTDQQQL